MEKQLTAVLNIMMDLWDRTGPTKSLMFHSYKVNVMFKSNIMLPC